MDQNSTHIWAMSWGKAIGHYSISTHKLLTSVHGQDVLHNHVHYASMFASQGRDGLQDPGGSPELCRRQSLRVKRQSRTLV